MSGRRRRLPIVSEAVPVPLDRGRTHGCPTWGDQGFALVAVVLSIAAVSLFLMVALAMALRGAESARRSQDAKTAEQAALAGVEEYVARLNVNDNYWKVSNTDPANPAFLPAGELIPGTGDSGQGARFRYKVLNSITDITMNGVIRLQVVGTSGPGPDRIVQRTVTAQLSRNGLLNYVYLTDKEVTDPDLVKTPASCGNFYYAVPDLGLPARPRNDTCQEITWTANFIVDGPMHSNDALRIGGATQFKDVAETSWPAVKPPNWPNPDPPFVGRTWWGSRAGALPDHQPVYAPPVVLPRSNNQLLKNVEPDVDGDGEVGPGCYYTGATRIVLQGDTMKVLSPSTTAADTPARCYDTSRPGAEQSNIKIPPVIYVAPASSACTFGAIGYPAAGEGYTQGGSTDSYWGKSTNYACTRGSVYVSGTSNTPVTITGADDVVITGDLKTNGITGTTLIGLIAGNCVWVYHPLKNDGSGANLRTPADMTVQAAILALRHSFLLQNWDSGQPLGNLNVTGAIAQEFRGPIAESNGAVIHGFNKNYSYDKRLKYTQPPFFLKADSSPFFVNSITDG